MDEKILELAETLSTSIVDEGIHIVRSNIPVVPDQFDNRCTECGDPIEVPRIQFGCITCLDCQEYLEKHRALRPELHESTWED